jgi:DNA repair exonuclease SbcCD ATPase subunit
MKLQRIVLEDYKRFTGKVVVDDLLPGLNVFTGPNESGKSTLVDALRKVFLERHKGMAQNGIAPWSKPTAGPQVEVKYEIDGTSYTLFKRFLNHQRCILLIGDKRLEGDEAEEELARMLGFERAGKGASRPELGGIPGLLWVRQGSSQEVQDSAQHAAQYLRDALGELAGGTIAQGDDVLIQAVHGEMTQLVTDKTRKPYGAYAEAEKEILAAKEVLEELLSQERTFNADVERLATLQAEFDKEASNKPWEALERRAADAAVNAQSLRDAEALVSQSAKDLVDAERRANLLNEQERAAVEDEHTLEQLTKELAALKEQAEDARTEDAAARGAIAQLESAWSAAMTERAKAESATTFAELKARLEVAVTSEEQLRKAVEAADFVAHAIRALNQDAARLQVDPTKLKRLQQIEDELRVLRARRDATLTKVEYRLEAGHAIVLGDASLSGRGIVSVDAPTILAIPGVGELTISPGVSDRVELRAQISTLESEFAALLQGLGATNLAEVEGRAHDWGRVTNELRTQKALLEARAPRGLDALKSSHDQSVAELSALRERMPSEPPEESSLSLADARAAVELVLSQFTAARNRENAAGAKRGTVEGQLSQTQQALDAKQRLMQTPEYQAKRAATRGDLVSTNAEVQSLREKRAAACDKVKELQATVDRDAEERLRKSAQNARDAHRAKNDKLIQLRTQLAGVGATGLGERIGEARARLEQLERRHGELEKQAKALQLLHDVLVDERDKVVKQLQAPLTGRIEQYLRRMLPQSRLIIADDLTPQALVRESGQGDFKSLSFGTQEQLGVVARLAYADLLKDAGRPTLLIFDDAVTHSDKGRLERIKQLLLQAASRHQVLLLSCHPENWDDVGVPMRAMDDFKTAAVAQ